MLLSDLLTTYRRTADIEESTAAQYGNVIGLIVTFGGESCGSFFQPEAFDAWSYWLRSTPDRFGRQRCGRTVNARCKAALTLWRFAFDKGLTTCPPPGKINKAREEREPPTAWSVDEMAAIVRAVPTAPRVRFWSAQHWIALLDTFWDTSARVEALLCCTHTDRRNGLLHLRANDAKEDRGVWLKLKPETNAELDALPECQGDPRLFPWSRSIRTCRRHYRLIVTAAGLPATRRDLFHRIRRSVATHVMAATGSIVDAQRACNHSSPSITMRSYIDPSFLTLKHAADLLPRIAR